VLEFCGILEIVLSCEISSGSVCMNVLGPISLMTTLRVPIWGSHLYSGFWVSTYGSWNILVGINEITFHNFSHTVETNRIFPCFGQVSTDSSVRGGKWDFTRVLLSIQRIFPNEVVNIGSSNLETVYGFCRTREFILALNQNVKLLWCVIFGWLLWLQIIWIPNRLRTKLSKVQLHETRNHVAKDMHMEAVGYLRFKF
jgi:hypothetical protein